MSRGTKTILWPLFMSVLVVVIAATKTKLEHRLPGDNVLVYFILFMLSLLVLTLIELLIESTRDADWVAKYFNRRDYIRGWWLNFGQDRNTREIYNFALLKIEIIEGRFFIDGRTFKVCLGGQAHNYIVRPDGHFFSTLSQYQSTRGLLGFHYTIDHSDKVAACGHKIFGNAEYFFERGRERPTTFVGEFSTESPSVFCSVTGHRIDEESITSDGSLQERYRKAFDLALRKKWVEPNQISKCGQD